MVADRFRSWVAGSLRGDLARASIGSFVLKGVGTIIAFGYSLVLARLLGVTHYGTYEYVIAWVMLAATPAVFGLDKLLVREVPRAMVHGDWRHAKGLLLWSTGVVLVLSLTIGAIGVGLAWLVGSAAPPRVLLAGGVALPLVALALLWEGALRGLRRIVEGQAPIVILRPLTALVLLVVAIRFASLPATASTALFAFAAAATLAVVASGALIAARGPAPLRSARQAYAPREWLTAAFPIMVMSGLTIANGRIGTIMLGTLVGAEPAGIMAVVVRGSDLIAFALVAVNAAVAPEFARLHASARHADLQRVVTRSARLIFALSLPIAVGLLLLGPSFLQLYGADFTAGVGALRIVVLGQLVNVSMGSVGVLLVMTGHERAATWGFGAAVATNVSLCFLLVPRFGLEGAAWAAAISIVVLNVALAFLVYRHLKLHASFVGAFPHRRGRS